MTKEQSVLTRIINLFEGENTQVKYNDLGCSIDLYFHEYKLAIKIDKNGHSHRIIDSEIKRQRAIEWKLGCNFIRIDFEKKEFNIFKAINEIFRHMKQSTKKTLINKL